MRNTILATIAAAFTKKYGARLGKRFGLTPQQITTIVTIGLPLLVSFIRKRAARKKTTLK